MIFSLIAAAALVFLAMILGIFCLVGDRPPVMIKRIFVAVSVGALAFFALASILALLGA